MIGLRRALWAIGIAAVLLVVVETALIAAADFEHPDRGLWIALNGGIGLGFVGVGLYAWYRRPDTRVGALMVATGFAWFVGNFALTEPPLLFTIGALLNNLFVAAAIHLLLAFPSGRLASRADRNLVVFTYVVTTVGFIPALLTADPIHLGCTDCPENLLLVDSNSSFSTTAVDVLSICGMIVLAAVLGRLIGRWRAATPPMRRVITPVFVAGGTLMMILGVALMFSLLRVKGAVAENLFYAALIPFGLVPYLFLAGLARARMLRGGAVSELVARIGGPVAGGELRDALARALNDPSLELVYWLPESECHVDPEGERVALPGPDSGRATSPIVLDGERVAVLVHDPMLLDEPELIEAVGAAAALALEKERLDAELRAKVGELRHSRARLIAAGLAERRRLERDLHDGAQQRLVSLALDLRLARGAVRDDPERAEQLLDAVGEELDRALGELRELARGIHPAVLSDRGLDPAVDALASRMPLPVEVPERLGERLSEPVELAAYFVVSEALTNVVKYARANRAVVRVAREDGRVVVEVADDGVGGADPARGSGLRGLADRVAALGGRLAVDSQTGAGTTVTARIPCE